MLGLNNVGPTQRRVPLLGVLPAGLGEGVGDCRDVDVTQKGVLIGSSKDNFEGKNQVFFQECVFMVSISAEYTSDHWRAHLWSP